MPGASMPGFKELADVIRRAGIYGPGDYIQIVQEQMKYWQIESITGLSELGRAAQERIMAISDRLRRVAELIETRSRAKTFSFDVVFNREFARNDAPRRAGGAAGRGALGLWQRRLQVRIRTASVACLQRGLPGYLILFAPHAFAPQRQYRPRDPPSPPVFLLISAHFTATPGIPVSPTEL